MMITNRLFKISGTGCAMVDYLYKPLKKDFVNFTQKPSGKKGKNFPDLYRVIMDFKGWLRGMHYHKEHLQAYTNEYIYRFN